AAGVAVAAVGHGRLGLAQPGGRVVRGAAHLGEKELHRLAGAPRNVLQRRQRGAGPASFDQVDRRRSHLPLAQLGQAQAGLEASLLDGAWTKVDAGKTASFGVATSRRRRLSAPAGHGPSLYTKT